MLQKIRCWLGWPKFVEINGTKFCRGCGRQPHFH